MWCHVVQYKWPGISEEISVTLMMEVASDFETSVHLYQTTWHHIAGDGSVHGENLRSYSLTV
jgi:hypothetical protein